MTKLVLAVVVLLAGCADPGDKVKRISSPDSDPVFVTRCRRTEQCIADAKVTCPNGYVKLTLEGDLREHELTFKCHGGANW